MSTQKHTPTPWKVSDNDTRVLENQPAFPGIRCIATNELIADIFGTSEECKADAEFIVRAVNSHDALVAALEEARKVTNDAADYFSQRNLGEPARILFGRLLAAYGKASEAIAAAKPTP